MKLGPYDLNRIYTGDARDLAKAIPDGSVDLIFTDPPYTREYMHLYEWLAKESARVLRPDGFLLTYAGVYWKDETMALVRPYMDYFADFILENRGKSPILWERKLISSHKSLLAYQLLGQRSLPRTNVLTLWRGGTQDKRYHTWGQSASAARYYIDCFSQPGATVVDFFLGGGTTAEVCQQLGRRWLGFEIEPGAVQTARARLLTVQRLMVPIVEQAVLL